MEIITTPVTPDHLISSGKKTSLKILFTFPPNPTSIFPKMYMK